MVAGLAFLSKKGFNPANIKNQKTVWEAQQQKASEAKLIKEREDQLRRERDDEELARARGGEHGGDRAKLNFMYDAPPGIAGIGPSDTNEEQQESESKPAAQETSNGTRKEVVVERQPGDDDAAAAFRKMLAAATSAPQQQNITSTTNESTTTPFSDRNGAALSGTTVEKATSTRKDESLSALEKAVGRRDASHSGLTLEEQIARFPQLKNAPMARGMTATNVNVTFKPLGTQLRNTRCFVCGVWGHSKGDRECAMSGWDPFSASIRPSLASLAQANAKEGVIASASSIFVDGPDEDIDPKRRSYDDDDRKKRSRDDYSSGSSDDSSEHRRRKRHRKKHRSRRHESKRMRQSPDEERRRKKSSHKRKRKHLRHDDD